MKKLKSRPPVSADDFISGAERKEEPATKAEGAGEGYPWEAPGIRDDVAKVYNLRLPEPYLLKLKYIAKHTPESMHSFCLKLLMPGIDKKIEELMLSQKL